MRGQSQNVLEIAENLMLLSGGGSKGELKSVKSR